MILQLTRELGVNLAGVEIILNMREKMQAMQKQIQGFIETLNGAVAARCARIGRKQFARAGDPDQLYFDSYRNQALDGIKAAGEITANTSVYPRLSSAGPLPGIFFSDIE